MLTLRQHQGRIEFHKSACYSIVNIRVTCRKLRALQSVHPISVTIATCELRRGNSLIPPVYNCNHCTVLQRCLEMDYVCLRNRSAICLITKDVIGDDRESAGVCSETFPPFCSSRHHPSQTCRLLHSYRSAVWHSLRPCLVLWLDLVKRGNVSLIPHRPSFRLKVVCHTHQTHAR